VRAFLAFCVERRLVILSLTIVGALYGYRAYQKTPIEAFPDVTNLQVVVIAQYPGFAPQEVERQVTIPLERVLNGVPGAINLRSESLFGLALIFLTFDDDADVFRSRALVNERVTQAEVPEGAVVRLGADATPLGEVFRYRLASDRHDLHQLRAAQEFLVSRVIRQVPGIADVVSCGGFLEELHVEIDPLRVESFGVTLEEVRDALARSSVNTGGGFLVSGAQELTIRGVGLTRDAADLGRVVIRTQEGLPVTVGDVARVLQSATPRRGTVGVGDIPETVEGIVILRRGENPSAVLEALHARLRELEGGALPAGMRIEPTYDRSLLVDSTLSTVHRNLVEGFFLILAVVWVFLRTLRGSLVVAVVIPLALLCAFSGLHALGMPANLISMGAIDFGILVDAAVVLVESVFHALGKERPTTRPQVRALVVRAAHAVSRPTVYAMAIIIAALNPVFSLERVEGRIFRPLAITYSLALLGALLLGMALVPALLGFVLKPSDAEHAEPRWLERLRLLHRRAADAALRSRVAMPALGLALLATAGVVGTRLGTEFLPALDEGDLTIFVEMPASISLAEGRAMLLEVRRRTQRLPEADLIVSEHGRPEGGTDNEGVNMSETFVHLKPRAAWRPGLDTPALIEELRASLSEIPGLRFNFSQPIKDNVEESGSGVRGQGVLKIYGPDPLAMRAALQRALEVLRPIDGIVDLDLYRDTSVPQLRIDLDRDALAREGVSVADAQQFLETALAGSIVGEVWDGERPVPVRVRIPGPERADVGRIGELLVPTPAGRRVPLRELAQLRVELGRASINRENNSGTMALKFNVEGRDLGTVIAEAMKAVSAVRPPEGHFFVWSGEYENQTRAMARLRVIVPLSILVVLGLLYSALGSARAAASILAVAPVAMTGGVFALWLADVALSVSAAVGFIALLGQVSLMGLLVLSAIDERVAGGHSPRDAALEGTAERLRSVLMTALLAMLGLLPMAFGTGVGSETQRPFALVIVGGMVTTLLTALFVLPFVYGHLVRPRGERSRDVESTDGREEVA